MSMTMELLSMKCPNPSPGYYACFPLKRPALCASFVKLESFLGRRSYRLSVKAPGFVVPKGLGLGLGLSFRSPEPSTVAFAASHEESSSEIEVEKEMDDLKLAAEESEEAWKKTLASVKEQALKVQSVSQEAYEVYSEKAMVILKEIYEQFKIQADKARHDFTVLAKEISGEGKEYLSAAAENSPEPVKEVVETFTSSTDDLHDISKLQDFHLGIPYGLLLSVGGFMSFMLTGSISAIRFGVILGGALLALSVSSLRSYKRGEPCDLALKGQIAIAAIIFLRDVLLLFQRASLPTFVTTVISGAMVAFYLYRVTLTDKQSKRSDLGHGAEN